MDIYEAISRRQTIRDFEDKEIPTEILYKILGAGLKAPTNDHLRQWEFILLQDKAKRTELVSHIHAPKTTKGATTLVDRWGLTDPSQREVYIDAVPKQHSMLMQAAVLVLPCFYSSEPLLKPKTLSSLNCLASIWCCVENILIAAASEGIFGVTRIPFEEERKLLSGLVNLPEGYEVPCYIALGYPKENAKRITQHEVHLEDKIHMNRW
ncbi:MAG: nitroreductase family protein [Flexilinea sp.]